MSTRYCICCGGPIRRRKGVITHAQWWRRFVCLRPTPLGPVLRDDQKTNPEVGALSFPNQSTNGDQE
jgi:hypothetical protein